MWPISSRLPRHRTPHRRCTPDSPLRAGSSDAPTSSGWGWGGGFQKYKLDQAADAVPGGWWMRALWSRRELQSKGSQWWNCRGSCSGQSSRWQTKAGASEQNSAQQGMLTGKQHSLTGREIECLSMLAASAGCCRLMCGSFRYCAAR